MVKTGDRDKSLDKWALPVYSGAMSPAHQLQQDSYEAPAYVGESFYLDEFDLMCPHAPKRTGVSVWIFTSPLDSSHAPRVKLSHFKPVSRVWEASCTVPKDPATPCQWFYHTGQPFTVKERQEVEKFIDLNREAILAFWHGDIDDCTDMGEALKPV